MQAYIACFKVGVVESLKYLGTDHDKNSPVADSLGLIAKSGSAT